MAPLLTLHDVRFAFPAQEEFLGPVSLAIHAGELWAVVGPNGAGKSTLLRIMAGLLRARSGDVRWESRPLAAWSRRERAKRIAFLPQQAADVDELTAREWVLLGRYPHRSLGLFESVKDQSECDRAMALTDVRSLADRCLQQLSGGEFQRVRLAGALVQRPRLMLLDEPTASLDLQHQLAFFRLVRKHVDGGNLAAVVVTHDVNLALRYCGRALLLHRGRVVACGAAAEVLTPETLTPVYSVGLTALRDDRRPDQRWIVPTDFDPPVVS